MYIRVNVFRHGSLSSKPTKTPSPPAKLSKSQNMLPALYGSINVRTCKDPTKLVQVALASKKLQHSITFIQETHMTGSGRIDDWDEPDLQGYSFVYSGFSKKSAGGVAVICNPDVQILDIEHVMSGRILRVRLNHLGIKLMAWCVYSPTNVAAKDPEKAEAAKTSFYRPLDKSVKAMKKDYPGYHCIIAGDWNATIGRNALKTEYVGLNLDDYDTTDNGDRLCSFANEHRLYIANTVFKSKDIHRKTWVSADKKTEKRLDYFLVDKFLWKSSMSCRAYIPASEIYESDHRLLGLRVRLPSKRQRRNIFQKRPPKPKPNLKLLRDDAKKRKAFSNITRSELFNHPLFHDRSPNAIEQRISDALNVAATDTCPPAENEDPVWYTSDFKAKIEEMLAEKDPKKRKKKIREMRKLRQTLKRHYYKSRSQKINQAAENRKIEEEFRLMREAKMVKNSDKLVCPPEKLREHFTNHFGSREVKTPPEISDPESHPYVLPECEIAVDESPPTVEEVKSAFSKLNNGKAIGTDGLAAELLKYNDCPALAELVTELLTNVWNGGEVPDSWKHSRVRCLFKNKGLASDPSKYRGLSINSMLNKVLMIIVLDRMKESYESNIMPEQYGFRSGVGTVDGIFVAKRLIKTTLGYFNACFIDLRAAFDHISRPLLYKILRLRTGANKLIDILEKNYENTTGYISGTKKTDAFDIKVGVRQGAQESPCIFNIFMDTVLRVALHEIEKITDDCGIEIEYRINMRSTDRNQRAIAPPSGKRKVKLILYADDIVLFCRSASSLQLSVDAMNSVFTRFGLKIAEDKTQTMIFNADEEELAQESIITLNGLAVENVRKFRYLGYWLNNTAKNPPLAEQISSAWSKWTEIKHILCDREINLWIRVKILESTVRARLLYAAQTDLLSSAEHAKLESIWHQYLRKMVKGGFQRKKAPPRETKKQKAERLKREAENPELKEQWDWGYKITNEKLRKICGATPIGDFADKFHLKYVAHVTRMPNNALQKQLAYCEPARTIRRGGKNMNFWAKLSGTTGIEAEQLQKTMYDRNDFNKWIADRYETHSRPAKFVKTSKC